jgi:hypothetical protein
MQATMSGTVLRSAVHWLAGLVLLGILAVDVQAANSMLGEVEIKATSREEKSAGVWVNGQYMGHVRQLKGKSSLYLIPGKHELLFKLVGYEDVRQSITVEPGRTSEYRLTMQQKSELNFPTSEQTAKLVLSVEPSDAAVFVNDQYAGHVDRFDGAKGMRLREGTYRFKITLPGYRPFETELTLRANQSYEIRTDLAKGSIAEQGDNLIVGRQAMQ